MLLNDAASRDPPARGKAGLRRWIASAAAPVIAAPSPIRTSSTSVGRSVPKPAVLKGAPRAPGLMPSPPTLTDPAAPVASSILRCSLELGGAPALILLTI